MTYTNFVEKEKDILSFNNNKFKQELKRPYWGSELYAKKRVVKQDYNKY